ncbi:HAD family phosphatase [Cohnella sp. AR92]|uniref:HAD family hydrolase n=1 Tax=Cohnella sp. AR92 TaxID=648716 RepID=UPI001315AC7A|nr:HAD-IB family phosphatase [Cohnella sp. AR92]
MRYALIDWDNTLHRGYTIYGLTDHLLKEGLAGEAILAEFERLRESYKAKEIAYAEYTIRTCEAFAAALEGVPSVDYRACVSTFVPADEPFLFEDVIPVLELLHRYEIEIYLVSGAPAEVLRAYGERLGIKGIFAFELEEREGRLTGRVECNYGAEKERILRHPLFRAPGAIHAVSMGDAVADVPLLDNSLVPIIVGGGGLELRAGSAPLRFFDREWDLAGLERRLAGALQDRTIVSFVNGKSSLHSRSD